MAAKLETRLQKLEAVRRRASGCGPRMTLDDLRAMAGIPELADDVGDALQAIKTHGGAESDLARWATHQLHAMKRVFLAWRATVPEARRQHGNA